MTKDAKNLIVGLDIGTSKVVAVVAEIMPNGRHEVIGLGQHESKGIKKRRGRQYRGDRRIDTARARRSRADGRLSDPDRLDWHRRQSYSQF